MSGRDGRINSAVVIARLLDCEGFSPETANAVRRYALRRSGFTKRQRLMHHRRQKDFREAMKKLTEGDKLLLGRFIAARTKAAFDAGLRMGLAAFAVENGKECANEDTLLESRG
jgi:hypothetical protein